ncbi:MAG TPA: gliding motility lipoprotein GldD [Bacteroidales bacterium]|nr:gliding motility lipoprotein GldD [Bacteroidales bacterium]HPF03579.1 gliding motility lipoprotein GldD [Bacteroidales bacterium]HPJ59404.1 gliding motility lipoprotein GldD [Bacteroidales bacterium]HPR12605.1 gliding motility lipoprotein GldD [Bacteroidales bacterium]HRW86096.1 gliding motility lipoprotein GldD [Bacteroidales bacterium]
MPHLKTINLFFLIVGILITSGCRDLPSPRPKGYFRIDLPEKNYITFNKNFSESIEFPLSFEYPSYGNISLENDEYPDPGWFNIEFRPYRAKIYLTYKEVENNLEGLLEQTYRMNVKNHIPKADAITEQMIADTERKVYGILYDLKGNTATAVQFFVTDSISHFLRGSLYFFTEPNPDSLAPVTEFFRQDIVRIIETLKWKKE